MKWEVKKKKKNLVEKSYQYSCTNIITVYFYEYRATTDAHFPVNSTLAWMTHLCGTTDLEEDSSFLWALAMTSSSSLSVLLKKKKKDY